MNKLYRKIPYYSVRIGRYQYYLTTLDYYILRNILKIIENISIIYS